MIRLIYEKLYNYPCWFVKQGHGSFLTLEFGEPYLEVREPRKEVITTSKKVLDNLSKRRVTVKGTWHLWIYCCHWKIYLNQSLLAESESTRQEIEKALSYLDGQKLIKIDIEPQTGNTTFEFDLGGILVTKRYNADTYEQWLLYNNEDKHVLSIRSDGNYSYIHGETLEEEKDWKPID